MSHVLVSHVSRWHQTVYETELTSPGQGAVSLEKQKLGVTKFHDQNLEVHYVKDAHPGTVWGQSTGLG